MFTKRDLARLIVPLIIEQILMSTIGIADTLMVSSVGEIAMSAVSLVDSLNNLLLQVFAALATGGAIVSAQYLGRGDLEKANSAARQLLVLTTGFACVLGVVCFAGRIPLLDFLFGSAERRVMEEALVYLSVSALSYPLIALYNAAAAIFRVQNNSRISMLAAALMNVTNILFNALFIFGLHMGVAGAALGSLIARGFGAFFLMWLLHHPQNQIWVAFPVSLRLESQMVGNILRIGVPNSIEAGIFQLGRVLVQSIVALFGTVALASNAVANSVMTISQMPGSAIGLAIVTVVGQCVGAKQYDQAKRYMIGLPLMAMGAMGILNLLIILGVHPVVGLFSSLSAESAALACRMIVVCCLLNIVFWPMAFVLPNGLRAASDVKFTMVVSILSMWTFRLGLSYVLAKNTNLGAMCIWYAMGLDWLFRASCFLARWASNRWKKNRAAE